MRFGVIVLCGLAVGCGGNSLSAPQTGCPCLGQDIEIANGKSAAIQSESLELRIDSVRDDSRCPINARCVWEGDATVAVGVAKQGSSPAQLELHTSGRFAQEATYAGYRVRLSALMPEPVTDTPINASAYRAKIIVSK